MRAASPAPPPSGGATASALVTALCGDPQALARLAQALVSAGLADAVHKSIDAAVAQHARQEAGRLLAGTVSTATGWLIPATGSMPAKAMVYLGGSTRATACVVAPHVLPDLAAGAQVWVEPVNGSLADMLIVSIRAFTATPVASRALTNAATAQTSANNAQTSANNAQTSANNALTAANRGGQFVAINPIVAVYGGSTASGTALTSVLTTSYGVPAGAKAIVWSYYFTSATTGASVQFYAGQSMSSGIIANFGYTPVANDYLAGQAIIPLDASGYFSWQIQSGDTITHFGRIVGYFI